MARIPDFGTAMALAEKWEPVRTAQKFIVEKCEEEHGNGRILHYYQGDFYWWLGTHYEEIETERLRKKIYRFLDFTNPTPAKVEDVVRVLRSKTLLDRTLPIPFWIKERDDDPLPRNLIACENGLLDFKTRKLHRHNPRFFTTSSLGFNYAPTSPRSEWMKFLNDLWPDDVESQQTLQEMMGYFLTWNTRQQKIFLIVGPKRSGKGTIAGVIQQLLGEGNVAGPTLSGLNTQFGLWPLIHKQIAIISDARLSTRADATTIAERLLAISGGDTQTIDRKNRAHWTGKLSVRFLICTNELPAIGDASGALASRFIILTLRKSFFGHEDLRLGRRLARELPGILNWALDGLDRLTKRKKFEQPEASRDAIDDMKDLASPVAAFVAAYCKRSAELRTPVPDLYAAWRTWCVEQGNDHPGTIQSFGRNLKAAFPRIKTIQTTDRRDAYKGIGLFKR